LLTTIEHEGITMSVAAALRQRCTHTANAAYETKRPSMTPRAIKRRDDIAQSRLASRCLDCRTETTFTKGNEEYYMIHNELWLKANPQVNGMLCIGCLESRLGRTITSEDFTDAPINQPCRINSKRLASRLAATRG
jgi:hypothetical protein